MFTEILDEPKRTSEEIKKTGKTGKPSSRDIYQMNLEKPED